jgi:ketosteroid isomerase-like protein
MTGRDQQLIDSLNRAYDALRRGDYDTAIDIAHPEVDFIPPGGAVKGVAALRAWMEPDAWEDQRIEPLEFRVNGNRVLVRQNTRGRGAASGIELNADNWAVWTFDDNGRVTRLEGFLLHEESKALDAAGLSE